jgi:hypothetical protein
MFQRCMHPSLFLQVVQMYGMQCFSKKDSASRIGAIILYHLFILGFLAQT